jgi:protein-disulfide isomerase
MSTYPSRLVLPVGERDHVRGPASAPVTVLEYGDYECPYCGSAHAVVEDLRGLLSTRIRFVYRHFPLTNVHPRAGRAAEAAEASGAQGRFWAMHDMLFAHQHGLEDEDLVRYAETIGLDVARFVHELAESTYRPRVREDFISGVRSGVNGTPTFYVNGVRHDGPPDLQSLLWSVQRAA